jgi:hypothetical protein
MCQKEAMWDLGGTSEVIEELLTIISGNVLKLLHLLVKNVRCRTVCNSEGGRFDPFPGPHHKNHTDEMWEAVLEAICS